MSDTKQNERKEILLAIRMNWLLWLSKPIQILWHVIVEAALALWRLITIASGSIHWIYNRHLLIRASIGTSVIFAVILMFTYMAGVTDTPILFGVGLVLSVLPIAWTIGETTAIIKTRYEKNGQKIEKSEIPKNNGFRVVGTMFLHVIVILLALALQALLSYLSAIPGVGPLFLGIILIPNVLLSVLAIITIILLSFSIMILPSQFLLEEEKSDENFIKRFIKLNTQILSTLKDHSYWIQLLIMSPVAFIFAGIIAVPMMFLVLSGFGLSTGIIGAVTTFSDTASQTLAGISALIPGYSYSLANLTVSVKIGMFINVLAVSIIFGIAMSPFLCGLASAYHRLFSKRNEGKTWTFVVLLVVFGFAGVLFMGTFI